MLFGGRSTPARRSCASSSTATVPAVDRHPEDVTADFRMLDDVRDPE
ncbi:MAG: hypothetical protein H6518_10515 [Microthrixaceae bacterium]|nr:hypothetical protein [Microthrixaceae bacterium]